VTINVIFTLITYQIYTQQDLIRTGCSKYAEVLQEWQQC